MPKKKIKMLRCTFEYITLPEDIQVQEVLDKMREWGEAELLDIEIVEREVK